MNFEDLQKSWMEQPVNEPNPEELQELVKKLWARQQRKLLLTNIFVTIAFLLVFVDFAWIYTSFRAGRSWLFTGSLLCISLLMMVYLYILWKGILYWREEVNTASIDYLDRCMKKLLWRRKTITHFTWIYAVLLWLALMCYYMDVLKGGTVILCLSIVSVTTAYIFGMQVIMQRTKRRRQLRKIDDLINHIQKLRKDIQ